MTINIAGQHMDVGESLQNHVREAIKATIEKYQLHEYESQVHFTKVNHDFKCDLNVHVNKNLMMHTKGSDSDAYKSFDQSLHKLQHRLSKYSSRLKSVQKRQSSKAAYAVFNQESEDLGADTPVTIAESSQDVPMLTVSEAVMRLEFADSPIQVFYNAASGNVNVVYRRKDGNIGWLNPPVLENKG